MTPEQLLEIVHSVQELYNTAWMRLLLVGALVLVALALLWALLVQGRQRHRLRLTEQEVNRSLEERLAGVEGRLGEQIRETREQVRRTAVDSVTSQGLLGRCVEAMLHHVQGVADLAAGRHPDALRSFTSACRTSLASGKGEETFSLFYKTLRTALTEAPHWSDIEQSEPAMRELVQALKQREETVLLYFAEDLETAIADRRKASQA